MKCGYCGKTLNDDAQFCTNCGHSTDDGHDEPFDAKKSEKGIYAISIFSLLVVLAMTIYGGYTIIYRDLHPGQSVSGSDAGNRAMMTDTDAGLFGQWSCSDPAAADYDKSNYGIEVSISLSLTENGSFTLDYAMTDTGIPAMNVSASGEYSTEDGIITFRPDQNAQIPNYLKNHGSQPAFQYATSENSFTLTYENGTEIVFNRVNQ